MEYIFIGSWIVLILASFGIYEGYLMTKSTRLHTDGIIVAKTNCYIHEMTKSCSFVASFEPFANFTCNVTSYPVYIDTYAIGQKVNVQYTEITTPVCPSGSCFEECDRKFVQLQNAYGLISIMSLLIIFALIFIGLSSFYFIKEYVEKYNTQLNISLQQPPDNSTKATVKSPVHSSGGSLYEIPL